MTRYEELLIEVEKQGVEVLEIDLGTRKKCGRYLSNEKESIIVINSNITDIEKYEILAEELGHYHTTYGNILKIDDIKNKKLELVARRASYKILVEPNDIIEAFRHGANDLYEIAEYVNVTVNTLHDIISDFKKQYGIGVQVGNYYLQFEPSFGVLKDFGGLFNYSN